MVSVSEANWNVTAGKKSIYKNVMGTQEAREKLNSFDYLVFNRVNPDEVYVYYNNVNKKVRLVHRDPNVSLEELSKYYGFVDADVNLNDRDYVDIKSSELENIDSLKSLGYKGNFVVVGQEQISGTDIAAPYDLGYANIPLFKYSKGFPYQLKGIDWIHMTSIRLDNAGDFTVDGRNKEKSSAANIALVTDDNFVLISNFTHFQFSNKYKEMAKKPDLDIQGKTIKQLITFYLQ